MAPKNRSVKHNQLDAFLKTVKEKDLSTVFLIHGEPYLIKQAFQSVSAYLLKNDTREFAMETLEGEATSMGDILEKTATFSFLVSRKIVAVKNIPLFQTSQGNQEIRFSNSDLEHLSDFIEKGLPANHFLILTTLSIDKRKKIYKTIADKGLVIDCSVASGVRKADLDEQRAVLHRIADKILSTAEKTIENQAFLCLMDLTGFDLELFSQNLEKLIVYSGKARTISIADVKAVIIRDKKDPIFNLTNAFMAKDLKNTLFYLNSLLNEGFHFLQILKSFENQLRKLIFVKCFTEKMLPENHPDLGKMNFTVFQQNLLPKIIRYDAQTKKNIEIRENYLSSKQGTKKKKSAPIDLFLAPNPKNAYPVYQIFQKSENFSLNELSQSLIFLSDLDYKLKSSSFDAKTQIENFIIKICSKGGFVYAAENKNSCHYF